MVPVMPPSKVKALLVACLDTGKVEFTGHAFDEMAKDNMTIAEVRSILRSGVVQAGELRGDPQEYRYQVWRGTACAVVSFRAEDWSVVVTAWDNKKKERRRR